MLQKHGAPLPRWRSAGDWSGLKRNALGDIDLERKTILICQRYDETEAGITASALYERDAQDSVSRKLSGPEVWPGVRWFLTAFWLLGN